MQQYAKWLPYLFIGLLVLLSLYRIEPESEPPEVEISYSEFKQLVRASRVQRVNLNENQIKAWLSQAHPVGSQQQESNRIKTFVPALGDPELIPLLESKQVEIGVEKTTGDGTDRVFLALLPWLIFIGLYFWFTRRMYNNLGGRLGGSSVGDFLSGKSKKTDSTVPKVKVCRCRRPG